MLSQVVQDVSVTYKTTLERRPTLRSAISRMGRREKVVREIEAVKNVSFDVPSGTVLRVVGANGVLTGYGGGIERKRTLLALEGGALF